MDLYAHFPKECRPVIEAFKVIYPNDKVAREEKISSEERLVSHQAHSKPIVEDLHT